MSLWRRFVRGARALMKLATADRDVADEVDSFLDQAAGALEAGGLSRHAARRTVSLEGVAPWP